MDNLFRSTIAGLEAIDIQLGNKLGNDLTDFFSECISYRDSLTPPVGIETNDKMTEYRISAMKDYMEKNRKKFQDILRKNTGFDMAVCYTCHNDMRMPGTGSYAIMTDVGTTNNETPDAYGRLDSTGTSESWTVHDLEELAEQVDMHTGRMTGDGKWKDGKRSLDVVMYFDWKYSFCLHDYYVHETQELTAEEITAIVMHEIGHAVTITGNIGNKWVTHNRAKEEMIRICKSIDNLDDAKVAAAKLRKAYVAANKRHGNVGPYKKGGALDIMTSRAVELTDTAGDYIGGTLLGMGAIAAIALFFTIVAFTYVIAPWYLLCETLFCELDKISFEKDNKGNKSSDVTTNASNIYLVERWADEYATRMGYGDALASGLSKIYRNEPYTTITGTHSVLRRSTVYAFTVKWLGRLFQYGTVYGYYDPSGYENWYFRLKRIRENTLAAFKSKTLPPEVATHLLNQVDAITREMQDAKSIGDTDVARAIQNIVRNLMSPVRWFQLINNANLHRDFEVLSNNIDAMTNNAFHALSYRLRYGR